MSAGSSSLDGPKQCWIDGNCKSATKEHHSVMQSINTMCQVTTSRAVLHLWRHYFNSPYLNLCARSKPSSLDSSLAEDYTTFSTEWREDAAAWSQTVVQRYSWEWSLNLLLFTPWGWTLGKWINWPHQAHPLWRGCYTVHNTLPLFSECWTFFSPETLKEVLAWTNDLR